MNEIIFNQVRLKLEKGQPQKAIKDLYTYCQRRDLQDESNSCSATLGRFARLENQFQNGLLTKEEYSVQISRLDQSVRYILEQIEDDIEEVVLTEERIKDIKLISRRNEKNYTNKLKNIAWLELGVNCAASVCFIEVPKVNVFNEPYSETGSGFLVKTKDALLVLTNHHVIGDEEDLKNAIIAFNYEQDIFKNMKAKFEYEADLDYFETKKELDYSIFSVKVPEGHPAMEHWKPLKLVTDLRQKRIREGEHVTIIQHPLGLPKKIALNENRITEVADNSIFYLTDTEKGSSGSPVFNDYWEVVALHWGADKFTSNDGSIYYNNGGTLIQKIKEDLATKGIELL